MIDFASVLSTLQKWAQYICIKYFACDLIWDVITCYVWSCDTGKFNVYDKIMAEDKKKIENMEIK